MREGAGRAALSAAQQKIFLAGLATTANVTQSAREAGSTHQAAYRTRINNPGFRAAWAAALAEGYARLELKLLQRALGQREELPDGVEEAEAGRKEPSDRVILTLLDRHRTAVAAEAARIAAARAPGGDPLAMLAAKLRRMRAAMAQEDAS